MFDENLEKFSYRRKTVRRPLLFFYSMVDAAANNAYILMTKCGRYSKSKKYFLKNLSFQLAKSADENRLRFAKQKYSVRDAAAQVGFSIPTESNVTPHPLYLATKKDAEYARNKPDHDAGPRQDSVREEHKQIWGGGRKSSLLRIRNSGPKNKCLYPEFRRILG